jgi:hypothetical protein
MWTASESLSYIEKEMLNTIENENKLIIQNLEMQNKLKLCENRIRLGDLKQ